MGSLGVFSDEGYPRDVDVSEADLGSITYVSVASSVKLTAAQVLDLDAIVIDAASGNVDVVVTTKAEIDRSNALSNGTLNLFSPANISVRGCTWSKCNYH